ncbi:MAG TPA: MarC family protein, partial [Thermogutta sp.]|nr:MarC family protein [Thermogutta sp.]
HKFMLCFVPLFAAVDAAGLLPLYLALTDGLSPTVKFRVLRQMLLTAILVVVAFVFIGRMILDFLGVTISDFMVAGGTMLFIVAMGDLFVVDKGRPHVDTESLGAVPLGVPLTVGPAVLTTVLLLANAYGRLPALTAAVVNVVLAAIAFSWAANIEKLLGRNGVRALSKIASLFIGAIAVMMVRKGVFEMIASLQN